MRRGRLAGLVLLLTLVAAGAMAFSAGEGESAVPARIVTVTRGDVRQIAAISGRLAWLEETAVYAALPGTVDDILVTAGERVAAGQALMRLDSSAVDRLAAAWAAQDQQTVAQQDVETLLESTVVRSPVNGVVRQLLVPENGPVTAGVPVALLSSSDQAVLCAASPKDAAQVQRGMQAELLLDGDVICLAEVTQVGPVTADPLTGRMTCAVTLIPEQTLSLPAGVQLDADVLLASGEDVPVLPVEAITDQGTVWRVYDGVCTEIPVEIVLSDEMNAWVRLPEGMQADIGEFTEGQRVTEAVE